ncbi:MAG: hypothetical protein HY270_15125 [Deltaproteobacteria bacterium]|nr:hypothetical protein [Deltaproteobacteria bacterium]
MALAAEGATLIGARTDHRARAPDTGVPCAAGATLQVAVDEVPVAVVTPRP